MDLKYKLVSFLAMLLVIFAFSACNQAQPNEGTRNNQGPLSEPDLSSEASISEEQNQNTDNQDSGFTASIDKAENGAADQTVLETDFFGNGMVRYSIKEIATYPAFVNAGIDADSLLRDHDEGSVLLITVTVENVDVRDDIEAHVNSFYLVTQDELQEQQEGAVYHSPIYFDQAVRDEDGTFGKNYFLYTLPQPGQEDSIVLGWQLTPDEQQKLQSGKLLFLYTLSDLTDAVYTPLQYHS